jgi:hypothetical protein
MMKRQKPRFWDKIDPRLRRPTKTQRENEKRVWESIIGHPRDNRQEKSEENPPF